MLVAALIDAVESEKLGHSFLLSKVNPPVTLVTRGLHDDLKASLLFGDVLLERDLEAAIGREHFQVVSELRQAVILPFKAFDQVLSQQALVELVSGLCVSAIQRHRVLNEIALVNDVQGV